MQRSHYNHPLSLPHDVSRPVQYRTLGQTDLKISAVSFGAGPISGLMVDGNRSAQLATIERAISEGVNWFDTAATYGQGESEQALARSLKELGILGDVHIATKVRVLPEQTGDIRAAIRESFESSCQRLGVERVSLLQLHNSVTTRRGDLPTSLSLADVLGNEGVLAEFQRLQGEGRVGHLGFTGLGDNRSLVTMIEDGGFAAAQIPLSVLSPLAGQDASAGSIDVCYTELAKLCRQHGIGVIAIRVMAGGALVGQDPSPHTHRTKFFTLDVFRRDQLCARALAKSLPSSMTLAEASIRYVVDNLRSATALIGLANPTQLNEAVEWLQRGPLSSDVLARLDALAAEWALKEFPSVIRRDSND